MFRDAKILFELKKKSYEPIEIESAFDGNFIIYGFRDDRDKISFLNKHFEIIKPY